MVKLAQALQIFVEGIWPGLQTYHQKQRLIIENRPIVIFNLYCTNGQHEVLTKLLTYYEVIQMYISISS